MSGVDEAVWAMGERQAGVIARGQALALGFSRAAIDWRVSRRVWVPVHDGVYRLAGSPQTWFQRAHAALLAAGPGGALSHRTAGFLHGLDGLLREPAPLDVTVPRGRRLEMHGVTSHRAKSEFHRVKLGRLTVTTLARTLVDLSAELEPLPLEVALDSAQRRFPRVAEWLRRQLQQTPAGTHGLATLKELLALRTDGATDSPLEIAVRRALRRSGLHRPALRHEVFDELGAFVARLDFAWPQHRVALHVDGYRWHHQRERFERDARQRARLAELGWVSVPVTSRGLERSDWLRALGAALEARAAQARLPLGDVVRARRATSRSSRASVGPEVGFPGAPRHASSSTSLSPS